MGKSARKPSSKAAVAHSKQQKTVIQKIAVSNAVKHFKSNTRALITMACGSGKTRVGFMTIERMKKTISIIAVPTLGLVKQMRDDAAAWPELSKHSQLLVCSSIRHGDVHERPEDYGLSVTTSPDVILEAMANASTRSKLLIVVTYQSFDKIAAAMQLAKKKRLKVELGMLVCDEAHNTAGDKTKKMSLCLSDKAAKISNRLFLTATPRVIGDRTKNPENHNCMDDVRVYGKNVYSLSFAEAVQKGITSDYEIRNMEVNWKGDDAKKLNNRSFQKSASRVDELARYLAREMKKRPGMRVFSFHTDCASAEAFNAALVKCGVWSRCITGEMPVNEREEILGEFEANGKSRVICSVRVFGEGVDVPSVDTVVFTDPLTSEIQIAQMVGRGQRIDEGKSLLSVYLPIFHPMGATSAVAEKTAKCSYFKTAIKVLRTMSSFDDRIVGEIRSKAEGNNSDDEKVSRSIFNQECVSAEFAKVVNSILLSKVAFYVPKNKDALVCEFRKVSSVRLRKRSQVIVCGRTVESWAHWISGVSGWNVSWFDFANEVWTSEAIFVPKSKDELIAAFRTASAIPLFSSSRIIICGRTVSAWAAWIHRSSGWGISWCQFRDETWPVLCRITDPSKEELMSIFRLASPSRLTVKSNVLIGGLKVLWWSQWIAKSSGWGITWKQFADETWPESSILIPSSKEELITIFRHASATRLHCMSGMMVRGRTVRTWAHWISSVSGWGITWKQFADEAWPESAEFKPKSITEAITRLRKDHKHRPAFGESPCGITADKWEAIAKRLNTTVPAIMSKAFPNS